MMLARARILVGDIGCRVLFIAAAAIHLATVMVAYRWYEGAAGWFAALVSAILPVLPEVYWTITVASAEGTIMHWYVLAVIAYPIVCVLFIAGGVLFFPKRDVGDPP